MRKSLRVLLGRLLIGVYTKGNSIVTACRLEELRARFGSLGPNAQISCDLQVNFADRVAIGDWVYIGPNVRIYGWGGLDIADHVVIGPDVTIMTSMHNFRQARFVPYDEVELLKRVRIGAACWLGLGVIVLPGVELGRGCIVGAGSVVTKSFADGIIVAGNPAKPIGARDMEQFEKHLVSDAVYLKHKTTERLQKVQARVGE